MGNSDKAKVIVYIEFGFLGLGTIVSTILVLFPAFFLGVFLTIIRDDILREQLQNEIGALTTLGSALIAIALLIWLNIVLTLCQGVKGISPPRLMIWLVINTIPTIIGIGGLIAYIVKNPDNLAVHIPCSTFLLYKLWSLWVVRSLRKEIKCAGPPDNFHALQYRQSRSYSAHSHHSHCQS